MKKNNRKSTYDRLVASGEIVLIDNIPVRVPRGDFQAAEKQRSQIRKQLARMAKSDDPWARRKAAKWAHLGTPKKRRPFWRKALEDVNPNGNVYRGLFTKTKNGWFGRIAEITKIVAAGPSLARATKSLASELKAHLRAIDTLCDENQKTDGVIVGFRPDGQVAIWIGEMSKLKGGKQGA